MKMLKLAICILCFNLLLPYCNAYALEYKEFTSNYGKESIISTGKSLLKWVTINGTDFEIYYSKDKINWELITNDKNKSALKRFYNTNLNVAQCSAIETDDHIIFSPRSYQFPLGMRNFVSEPGSITVLNKENFCIEAQSYTGGAIGLTSYIDGKFYALIYTDFYSKDGKDVQYEAYRTATEQKTVSTTDFEEWHDYSVDGSIPISNGNTVLMTKNSIITPKNDTNLYEEREIEAQQVYIRNRENNSEIIYESVDVAQIFPFKDLYIGIPSTDFGELRGKFLVSYDGVYFNTVDLPKNTQCLYTMSEIQDNMVLLSINSYISTYTGLEYTLCDYDALKACAVETSVYVQYDDSILGFETPPIIEEGRTLVPMRFLFEQMGATVDWNAETQTATATLNDTAVTFAVDDTEAIVNSQPTTMEVPAQLVNGKTMVPLRFLSEELGYTVTWDEETRTAIIE